MNKPSRKIPFSMFWVLLVGLCLGSVAQFCLPASADAVPRKQSSEPLMGDPDTPEAPTTETAHDAKPARTRAISTSSTLLLTDMYRGRRFASSRHLTLAAIRILLGRSLWW